MIFYTENNDIIRYRTNDIIGGEVYGTVYRISMDECVKKFRSKNMMIDKDALLLIQELGLDNFCKIKRLLYNKNRMLVGYLMEYYQKDNIDILTLPTNYTMDNLYKLYSSVMKLSENNIFIDDMHTGNIIMNKAGITIIDYDLYVLNGCFTGPLLKYKNIRSLRYLFKEIYKEALVEYHKEYNSELNRRVIDGIFELWTPEIFNKTCKKLARYKYPIDYIKKEGNL